MSSSSPSAGRKYLGWGVEANIESKANVGRRRVSLIMYYEISRNRFSLRGVLRMVALTLMVMVGEAAAADE